MSHELKSPQQQKYLEDKSHQKMVKTKQLNDLIMPLTGSVVFYLGPIEPQGFVQSVSRVRQRSRILRLFSKIQFLAEKIKTTIHKQFKRYSFFSNIYHGTCVCVCVSVTSTRTYYS